MGLDPLAVLAHHGKSCFAIPRTLGASSPRLGSHIVDRKAGQDGSRPARSSDSAVGITETNAPSIAASSCAQIQQVAGGGRAVDPDGRVGSR